MKKNTIITILTVIIIYLMMVHYNYLTQLPPPEPIPEEELTPLPDLNREVYKYDWDNHRYIYRDDLPKEMQPKMKPDTFKGKLKYLPDEYVKVVK